MLMDHEALMEIFLLLSGREWSVDDLDTIAAILVRAGYPVRDMNNEEL